jgi:hypothetical protein
MKFSHKLHSMLFGPETTNFLPDIKKNRGVIIEIFYSDHFSQYTISSLGVSVHRSSTKKNIKILQINKSSAWFSFVLLFLNIVGIFHFKVMLMIMMVNENFPPFFTPYVFKLEDDCKHSKIYLIMNLIIFFIVR